MTVTVAIACYNQSQFLAAAIRSVLSQSRPADEIIVVDDGSTDDTLSVATSCNLVSYIRQDNGGLSAARNSALRLASSKFILFLDADDLLKTAALELAEACILKSPASAFVYGGHSKVDRCRRELTLHSAARRRDPFLGLLESNYIEMHGTVLYDAAKLRAAGGFDVNLRGCEDLDVYLRLCRRWPPDAYDYIAAEYRQHGASMSRGAIRMVAACRRVIDRHSSSFAFGTDERRAARFGRRFMTHFYATRLLDGVRDSYRGGQLRMTLGAIVSESRRHPTAALMTLSCAVSVLVSRIVGRRLRR